jgi:hypothetical protein
LKKPTGSVRFRFYKPKTKKKLNRTEPKQKNPEKNRAKPKNRVKLKKTEPKQKNRAKPV